jgi:hypothetical protein
MTSICLDPRTAADRAVRRSREYGEPEHLPYADETARALEVLAVSICDSDDRGDAWYAGWDWLVVLDRP